MGFIALILTLMLEQVRALSSGNPIYRTASSWVDRVRHWTRGDRSIEAWSGWLLAVLVPVLIVLALEWLAGWLGWLVLLALHVGVLYLTVGLRQFSHAFTEIQSALNAQDAEAAREALERWARIEDPGFSAAGMSETELSRQSIARALVAAHRHVFGPLFWYLVLPGLLGPVLYRMAQLTLERWQRASRESVARDAYRIIDWIPVRLAAAGFAVVGNFEDSVYCARAAQAAPGGDDQARILLLSGGGALGLRLEAAGSGTAWSESAAEAGEGMGLGTGAGAAGASFEWQGAEPDPVALRSAAALVWRAIVLWLGLFGLLTLAHWLARLSA